MSPVTLCSVVASGDTRGHDIHSGPRGFTSWMVPSAVFSPSFFEIGTGDMPAWSIVFSSLRVLEIKVWAGGGDTEGALCMQYARAYALYALYAYVSCMQYGYI